MTVSRRLRFEVLRRDGFRCRYCGASAQENALQVDHVHPVALGGKDVPENLTTACIDCNGGKSSVPADADTVGVVGELAEEWADAVRQAAAEVIPDRWELDAFRCHWDTWKAGNRSIPIPNNWFVSIEHFLKLGLPMSELEHLVDVAMAADNVAVTQKWRYFCGCAWRTLERIQERAAEIVERNKFTQEDFDLLLEGGE